jgi:cell division protein FtsB
MPSDPESQPSNLAESKQKGSPQRGARSLALDVAHGQAAAPPAPGSGVSRWAFRVAVVVALAWVIGYLPLQLFGERGLAQYRRLSREQIELQERNRRLAGEIRQMKLEVERLREDDVFLEKAAREDLGMVRKGELVFVIEEK